MNSEEVRQKIFELIGEFDTAMLVTAHPGWGLRARPMAIADTDDQGGLWFVTSSETPKVEEVEHQPMVNLTMQSQLVYVTITGVARIHKDPEKIRSLWKESWRVWFPEGPDQQDLVLLRVQPTGGEFWDNRGPRGLRYLWEATKAYAKGERVEGTGDNAHGKASL